MKTIYIATMLMLLFTTTTSTAKNEAEEAADKNLSAVTIFMDITAFTRKNSAARKMTNHHNEFAAKGYELVSVNPYTENGDLEGFFLSYKKR